MNQQRAAFRRFEDCTQEDIEIISQHMKPFARDLPNRVLDHLQLLGGDHGGFNETD